MSRRYDSTALQPSSLIALPRLGFIGTGWIGRLRMEALREQGCARFAAVYDPCPEAAMAAAALGPHTRISATVDDLLQQDLDGVVIATPSALHADQCIQALRQGKAVFCQKPLARTATETRNVINAARAADRRLAVDFSYRHLAGMEQVREMVMTGELGDIFAADLTFHNAYGPDKPWFYDYRSSGGGCVMDLGIHLVDLVTWLLGGGDVSKVTSSLFHQGKRLPPGDEVVEDYAVAAFDLAETHVQLSCSWNLHAGQDAVIEASLYGTKGSIAVRNVSGSFFDFEIHRFTGTGRHKLSGYPDAWGGRALSAWADGLGNSVAYDPSVETVLKVAEIIDRIYHR